MSKDLNTLSAVELMVSWQIHAQRLNRSAEGSLEQAFQRKVNVANPKGKGKE